MTPRIAIIGLVFLSVVVGVQPADAQDDRLHAGVSGMWSTQGSAIPGGLGRVRKLGPSGYAASRS
jgi:hypothetical protein